MREITHAEQCQAADYAGDVDYDSRQKCGGKEFAEGARIHMSLGVFFAFDWLKDNGFKVTKEEGDGKAQY